MSPSRIVSHVCRVLSCPTGVLLMASLLAGCGGGNGGSSGNGGGTPPGDGGSTSPTSVTLLASSTANDQISAFALDVSSLTLTSQSGTVVTVPVPESAIEYIHSNGLAEPFGVVPIPQGSYTSATVTIGNARFSCAHQESSGSIDVGTYAYGQTPQNQVSVTLPSTLQITGAAMALDLNLLVSQSATADACLMQNDPTYSISPAFQLSAIQALPSPVSADDGLLLGIEGQVSTTGDAGGSVQVAAPDGAIWQFTTSSATVFTGIGSAASLTAGTPVDVDAALQSDGSLLASRVSVYDADTTNLNTVQGPLLAVYASVPVLNIFNRMQQGMLAAKSAVAQAQPFNFTNATFGTSGQFTNLGQLPFPAAFAADTMVAGQNVLITFHAAGEPTGTAYFAAQTATLMPQTLDGTVTASGSAGNFQTYTVSLSSYNLFPNLDGQAVQRSQILNPAIVTIYTDNSTRVVSAADAVGATSRFYGLVFNDHGALRMDCSQISSGVAQ